METIINQIIQSNGMNICIIGKNGAGKTTFVKELLGIKSNEQEKNNDIQANIIFQNPENNFIEHIVYDDISFGLINHGVPKIEMNDRVAEIAAKLNIKELLDRIISTLSGGEKQRVAVAGAVVTKPKLIIFDEVTSMLDPANKRSILSLITQLNKAGITTLSITHDYDEVLSADRVLHIENRGVNSFDTPVNVFKQFTDNKYIPERFKVCLYLNKVTNISMDILVKKSIKELVEILWELHSPR